MNERRRTSIPARGFTLLELLIVVGVILVLTALTATLVVGIQSRSEARDTENTLRLLDAAVAEWELTSGRQIAYGRSTNFGAANEPNCPAIPVSQQPRYELPQLVGASPGWGSETDAAADALRTTDMLWSIIRRNASAAEIIARINPDYMMELDPDPAAPDPPAHFGVTGLDHLDDHMNSRLSFRFLDAWGNPIIAVMPGRRFSNRCPDGSTHDEASLGYTTGPDLDGTIRTPFENRFGVAANRRIFFVSAGPSGVFGDLHLNKVRPGVTVSGATVMTGPDVEEAALAADNIYSYEIIIEEGRPKP